MAKMLNKYRIRERLVRGFVIAAAIPAAVAVAVLISLIVISQQYSSALEDYGFAQGDVGKCMFYFAEARSSLRTSIGFTNQEAIERGKTLYAQYQQQFTEQFAALESSMVSQANKDIYNYIDSKLDTYWALADDIIAEGATTDQALSVDAQNRAWDELNPLFTDINENLVEIMDIKVDNGDGMSTLLTIVSYVLFVLAAVFILIAIFLSISMGKGIAVGIATPLGQLQERLEGFAQGDLSSPFPTVNTDDEVGDMVKSANHMAESLIFIISDLENILGRMAESDYTVRSSDSARYVGEFRQLYESCRVLRDGMVSTIKFIGESSVQVLAGSDNLAETSQSLAEGATEQASAVEELQATIITIAEAATQAAASAEEAYHQSQRYADVANHSSEDMKEMVEAMARINETSKKIGNIISEIENIASQTNLLSLNASIEAARAGDAGRGFAVVADQIRQLADQSSKSAIDTRALIEGAMQEIDNGNKVADRAVASIESVVDGIRKVATSSKDLSEASATQATTMKEAEDGVNQISDVIQTNAAVAEESSATSQQLSAQAASLDALIAKFELPSQ